MTDTMIWILLIVWILSDAATTIAVFQLKNYFRELETRLLRLEQK